MRDHVAGRCRSNIIYSLSTGSPVEDGAKRCGKKKEGVGEGKKAGREGAGRAC